MKSTGNGRKPQAGRHDHQLEVVYRRIEELVPDRANARCHTKQQVNQLARSIRAFGFNIPVVIDAKLKVIAGHGRIAACRRLGWSEVPTISLDHLSEEEAQAFAIADNRLTELSSWDEELLGEQFKMLSDLDLTFDLDVTGFALPEIDLLIENLKITHAGAAPPEVVPPIEPGPAISRPGDLWLLGKHRVYCGNSLDDASYQALMGKDRAAMVFTDPPYNVPIEGHVSGLGRHHREFAMAAGEMGEAGFIRFLAQACRLMAQYSRDGALHFICMDWRHVWEIAGAGREVYTELKHLRVWAKDNAGMGSLYRSQHELVFVFKRGRGRHRNNVELGKNGRNRSNVRRYPCARSFSRSGEEGNLTALHPTVKPVQLVADAILDCSERNAIVLDAFLGSGTTLIAAERTGRCCRAVEIDPLYVDARSEDGRCTPATRRDTQRRAGVLMRSPRKQPKASAVVT